MGNPQVSVGGVEIEKHPNMPTFCIQAVEQFTHEPGLRLFENTPVRIQVGAAQVLAPRPGRRCHARAQRPDLPLRIGDGRHPSLAGTYLAACTFFAALYQQSPEGLACDAGLGEDTALYLQQVAWRTVQDYARRRSPASFPLK